MEQAMSSTDTRADVGCGRRDYLSIISSMDYKKYPR